MTDSESPTDTENHGIDATTQESVATDTEQRPGGGSTSDELRVEVQPSATAIDWGDPYSVTVTLAVGSEYPMEWVWTEIGYESETGSGTISETEDDWDLSPGESATRTVDVTPPTTGEITFTLRDRQQGTGQGNVIAEWTLVVDQPVAAFGEAVQFYDGLAVTTAASLQEALDTRLFSPDGEDLGVYTVRPAVDEQWAVATVRVSNAGSQPRRPPTRRDITLLAAGLQLEAVQFLPDSGYTVDGQAPADAYLNFGTGSDAYPSNPDMVAPGAAISGNVVHLADTDSTLSDLNVLVEYDDVRARWE